MYLLCVWVRLLLQVLTFTSICVSLSTAGPVTPNSGSMELELLGKVPPTARSNNDAGSPTSSGSEEDVQEIQDYVQDTMETRRKKSTKAMDWVRAANAGLIWPFNTRFPREVSREDTREVIREARNTLLKPLEMSLVLEAIKMRIEREIAQEQKGQEMDEVMLEIRNHLQKSMKPRMKKSPQGSMGVATSLMWPSPRAEINLPTKALEMSLV